MSILSLSSATQT